MEDRTMRQAGYLLGLLAIAVAGMAGTIQAAPAPLLTYGHPALQAIENAYQTGEIDRAQALIYRVQFVKAFDQLPTQLRLDGPPVKGGTLIVLQAYEELEAMGRGDAVGELRARPSNLTLTRTTAHFLIHYTLTGTDATTESYVDAIQDACEVSWTSFHTTYGWDLPPSDGAAGGGTDLVDIYVHVLGGSAMGMAEPESQVPPNPPANDMTGFMHINTNIANVGYRKSTVAHEYMHIVEFGYNASSYNSWWMENCAMEAQEWAYDSVNDYRLYIPAFFGAIQDPLWTSDGQYEYGQITWPMYQDQRFSFDLAKQIWDNLQWGFSFFDANVAPVAIAAYGYTLEQAFHEFKTWCVYTNYRNDGNHYEEAGSWSSYYYPDLVKDTYPTGDLHPTSTKRPNRLGSSIQCFRPQTGSTDNILTVNYDGPPCAIAVTLFYKQTGVAGHTEYYMQLDANGNGTIDIPGFNVADWVLMLVSMGINCTGPMDYIFSADTSTGASSVDESTNIGQLARIYPNYPNPVADRTALSYSLPRASVVDARVVDANGRVVRNLFSGEQRPGAYEIIWNRQDDAGREVASGVYYAVVHVDGQELTRQMTVLK
jgi:hypothetical protein